MASYGLNMSMFAVWVLAEPATAELAVQDCEALGEWTLRVISGRFAGELSGLWTSKKVYLFKTIMGITADDLLPRSGS